MAKLIIDGKEIEAEPTLTLLQACEMAGAEIPRFCYHERLSIAGNCRMCLVEWVGSPKPQASCALQVRDIPPNRDGTPAKINTSSPVARKAREGVMEFLLINHPLDCPICDQGGECDLQDQAMGYGRAAFNRFEENKRAVEDMEITTYLEKAIDSELSGNVIDLCPVGALLSKPYSFTARPWELRKTESIDVMDAMGCNIRIDSRGREVMRILPRINEGVNEEWLGDKSRFVWDGLKRQRLDRPFIRRNGKLEPASWAEAFAAIAAKVKATAPAKMAAIVGDLAAAEEIKALRDLMRSLNVTNLDCRQDGAKIGGGPRQSYLFNSTFAGIEAADALLLVGTNPRWEAPVLNARIRKTWLYGNLKIANIGTPRDLTYPVQQLGTSASVLEDLVSGANPFADILKNAARPMIIVGAGALARPDGAAILHIASQLAASTGAIGPAGPATEGGWSGLNVLHSAASRVAGLDLSFLPSAGGRDTGAILEGATNGDIDFVYLLGADEIDTSRLGKAFVVYQGTHGDIGAHRADVILPAAAYTEKSGLYVNAEGRVQLANRATFPPGEAKEDWAILRALSDVLGKTLPYDTVEQLREKLYAEAPHFAVRDVPAQHVGADPAIWNAVGTAGKIDAARPLNSPIADYYLSNAIARSSETMAECSRIYVQRSQEAAE